MNSDAFAVPWLTRMIRLASPAGAAEAMLLRAGSALHISHMRPSLEAPTQGQWSAEEGLNAKPGMAARTGLAGRLKYLSHAYLGVCPRFDACCKSIGCGSFRPQ
jgi:hypothetical protein